MKKTVVAALLTLGTILSAAPGTTAWKDKIPHPIFDKDTGFIELYNLAWQQAYDHLKHQPGLPQSPYMDEALWDDTIWIWDTCFMVQFCKYAPDAFPGVESLHNFYTAIHDSAVKKENYPLKIQHPDNPPLFAWCEYDYFRMTNDTVRLSQILDSGYLQKHFEWFDSVPQGYTFKGAQTKIKRTPFGYHWSGTPSGMDNTPRGRGVGYEGILWVDAIAQQGLSALYIARMYETVGKRAEAHEWLKKYHKLKALVNQYYWDEEDGFYYDIDAKTLEHIKVKTPASFWPLLAEMASRKQGERQMKAVTDTEIFGGKIPWPTVDRKAPEFDAETGNYWRGGVWIPTAYMGIKAAEKYGCLKEAAESAENLVQHMLNTYRGYAPHTIWECYRPNTPYPSINHGKRVGEDFCGWSALGPISLFIENILGFYDVDGVTRTIHWDLHQPGRHGIQKLRFADITTDIVFDGQTTVDVVTDKPYTLVINGKKFQIKSGKNKLTFP